MWKIFGDYFWLIFIPTEDLGDPFLVILCLLKILVSISCWFYAYWRSWRLVFVWKHSMAVFAFSYRFSTRVSLQSLVCQTTYSRWYRWSDFTLSINQRQCKIRSSIDYMLFPIQSSILGISSTLGIPKRRHLILRVSSYSD